MDLLRILGFCVLNSDLETCALTEDFRLSGGFSVFIRFTKIWL